MQHSWNGALCLFPIVSLWTAMGQGGWNLHCFCSSGSGGAAKCQKCEFRSCPLTKFTSLLSRCATPLNKRQLQGGFFFFFYFVHTGMERERRKIFKENKMHRTVFLTLVRICTYTYRYVHAQHISYFPLLCDTTLHHLSTYNIYFFITINLLKRFFYSLGEMRMEILRATDLL